MNKDKTTIFCLKCDRPILSTTPENRICPVCEIERILRMEGNREVEQWYEKNEQRRLMKWKIAVIGIAILMFIGWWLNY